MIILRVENPTAFISNPYSLHLEEGFAVFKPSSKTDSFVEMLSRRKAMATSPIKMKDFLLTFGCTYIANIGLTQAVEVVIEGQRYAFVNKRANNHYAHICAYLSSGKDFQSKCIDNLLSEFILTHRGNLVCPDGFSDLFPDRQHLEISKSTSWSFTSTPTFEWIPSMQNGLFRAIFGISNEGFYLDPFSGSAQIVRSYRVEIHNVKGLTLASSVKEIQDSDECPSKYKGKLLTTPGSYGVLIKISDKGYLTEKAYHLIAGELKPVDLSQATFHAGFSPVDSLGICQYSEVMLNDFIEERKKFSTMQSQQLIHCMHSNHVDIDFVLLSELPDLIAQNPRLAEERLISAGLPESEIRL